MSTIDKVQQVLPIFDEPVENAPEPQGIKAVLNALRQAGAPLDIALKSGGFSMEDYEGWLDDDEQEDLIRDIRKAEADFCIRALKQVVNSADMGDAKSAQWLLERRFTSFFGKATKTSTVKETRETEILVEDIGTDLLGDITQDEFRLMAVEILRRKLDTEREVSEDDNDSEA